MKYYLRVLQRANAEFEGDLIDAQFKKRGVKAEKVDSKKGRRFYRIPPSEVDKLPVDEEGHYLPVDDGSGYSIWAIDDDEHLKFWLNLDFDKDEKVHWVQV